jgi:hypothetical protein
MATWVWIVIGAVVVLVVVLAVSAAARVRRTKALREGFGREYDRTVEHEGDRRAAERELRERQKRHDALDIRPLSPQARERYVQRWQGTQTRFVDDPSGAVIEADALVQQVMKERGYPTDDFEQRAADISVEHPELVERYRTAHGIAQANERGKASTEDLRQSVRHYRALCEELLGGGAADAPISRDATGDEDVVGERAETDSRTRTS